MYVQGELQLERIMQYLGFLSFIYGIFNLFYLDLMLSAFLLLWVLASLRRRRLPLPSLFFGLLLAYTHLYCKYSPEFAFFMDREDVCIQAVGHVSEPVIFEVGPPMRIACKGDDGRLVELIPGWVEPALAFLKYAAALTLLAWLGRWLWRIKNSSARSSIPGPSGARTRSSSRSDSSAHPS